MYHQVSACLLVFAGLTSACNELSLRDWGWNAIGDTYRIPRGGRATIICDGTCQGTGFTPSLMWSHPSGRVVESYPDRIVAVFQESRRQKRLYIQDFRATDVGTYTCRGWVKGEWKDVSITLLLQDEITTAVTAPEADGNAKPDSESSDPAELRLGSDDLHPLPQPNVAK